MLAGGATAWRDLPVPGRELSGIYQAMEYLPWSNKVQEGDLAEPPITAAGKHVVIIGGGDTGADCLGTAIRQGAASVHQFEILPRPPDERPDAHAVADVPDDLPRRVRARRGRRARLRGQHRVLPRRRRRQRARAARRTRSSRQIVDGRMTFEKVEGTDFELPCELVLLAMGFVGPQRAGLLEQLGVELNERGNVDARRRLPRRTATTCSCAATWAAARA